MKEFVAGGQRHLRALRREAAGLAATLTGVGFCFFVVDFVVVVERMRLQSGRESRSRFRARCPYVP